MFYVNYQIYTVKHYHVISYIQHTLSMLLWDLRDFWYFVCVIKLFYESLHVAFVWRFLIYGSFSLVLRSICNFFFVKCCGQSCTHQLINTRINFKNAILILNEFPTFYCFQYLLAFALWYFFFYLFEWIITLCKSFLQTNAANVLGMLCFAGIYI